MAAPTFNASYPAPTPVNWDASASPVTTASINRATGDVLVAVAVAEDTGHPGLTPASATGIAWTLRQQVTTANRTAVWVWTAVASSAANTTISFSEDAATAFKWAARVFHFSDSDGVGVSNKGDATDSASSVTLTGVTADSAIVIVAGDWEAGAATGTTWRTADAGTFTQVDAVDTGTEYTAFTGYHANAGSAGDKAVGWSAPTTRDWSLAGVEVLGTAGATNIPLNQITETETAQATAVDKTVPLTQETETETSQTATVDKAVVLTQKAETETSQTVTTRKTVALGQPAETETAQPLSLGGGPQTIPLGQVAETETSQAAAVDKTVAVGQATETETSQPATARENIPLAQAAETEAAQDLIPLRVETLTQTAETETAQAITLRKFVHLGQPAELETAQPMGIGGTIIVPLGQVVEDETANGFAVAKLETLGRAAETEAAQLLTFLETVALTQAVEVETVQSITAGSPNPGGTLTPSRTSRIMPTVESTDRDVADLKPAR